MTEWYDDLPPLDRSLSETWSTQEFHDRLRAWCESVVGPVVAMEQHKLRGWATVWRVTTAEGGWFAKQNCPGQQVEVPLMEALARLAPGPRPPGDRGPRRFPADARPGAGLLRDRR